MSGVIQTDASINPGNRGVSPGRTILVKCNSCRFHIKMVLAFVHVTMSVVTCFSPHNVLHHSQTEK
eukprot:4360415-Amphidinium_carterae.1